MTTPSSPVPAVEAAKLLPCPFCGMDPTLMPCGVFNKAKHEISCENDDCDVNPSVTGFTADSATAKWNARTPTPGRATEPDAMGEATPAAKWRQEGKADPHGDRYDCERAKLVMGNLTDDEMANAVFIYGDARMSVADLMAGKPTPTVYLTAAKDRIRWLSRALALAATRAETAEAQLAALTPITGDAQ